MTSTPQDGPADRRFVVLSDVPALDGIDALGFEAVASRLERIILAFAVFDPVHGEHRGRDGEPARAP